MRHRTTALVGTGRGRPVPGIVRVSIWH